MPLNKCVTIIIIDRFRCCQLWSLEEEQPKEVIHEAEPLERKVTYKKVIVTEVTKELHVYAQTVETGEANLAMVTLFRREFYSWIFVSPGPQFDECLTLEVTIDNFHGVHRLELYIVAF